MSVLAVLAAMVIIAGCAPSQPKPAAQTPAVPETVAQASAPETTAAQSQTPALEPAAEPAAEKPSKPEIKPGSTELPKLWDFWATWCPPCRTQKPIVEELAAEYKGVIEIVSINVDENQELAKKFKVQAIPTLVFLDASGKELDRRVGLMQRADIVAKFKSLGFIQ